LPATKSTNQRGLSLRRPAPPPSEGQLPPYRPPSHSDQELHSDLEQAKVTISCPFE
ncbi:hypothetical protein KUCAC02_034362, partial [Chaenocephalus aceratus]